MSKIWSAGASLARTPALPCGVSHQLGRTHTLWPSGCAVDVPMRLVSDRHAHASPSALLVRQPRGAAAEVVVAIGAGAAVAGSAGGVVGWAGGAAVGGAAVGGGVGVGVVCAKLIGAAIRKAAAARMRVRFMLAPP